jgi:hypothetical protein
MVTGMGGMTMQIQNSLLLLEKQSTFYICRNDNNDGFAEFPLFCTNAHLHNMHISLMAPFSKLAWKYSYIKPQKVPHSHD